MKVAIVADHGGFALKGLPIPGKPYTFRRLLDAQSAGDLQALRARDRRVARARLSDLEEVL